MVRWVKVITVIWPLISFGGIVVFFLLFHRPLRQILEQFNCCDLVRFRLGPLEIEKQPRGKPVRTHARKKK
jgi:hypothetical protein